MWLTALAPMMGPLTDVTGGTANMSSTVPQFEATQTPTATYRAAVVHDFHGPLTVEQVAPRVLEPGQVRVKV